MQLAMGVLPDFDMFVDDGGDDPAIYEMVNDLDAPYCCSRFTRPAAGSP